MRSRAQTSVELLIILAVSLTILAVLISFTTDQISQLQKENGIRTAQRSMNELTEAINRTYLQGPGAVRQLELTWPPGLDSNVATISGRSILVRMYGTDIAGTVVPPLTGTLATNPGTAVVRITAYADHVALGGNRLSPSVTSIYLPLAPDSNGSSRITLSNLSSDAATISLSLPWSETLVTIAAGPSSATLAGNESMFIDVNAVAGASAIGNYVGTLTITGTYSSLVEALSIPVNIEVHPATNSLLTASPSSVSLNVFGLDTNSTLVQLCNTSDTTLNSLSFHPSTGNAGDWVQSLAPIASLAAHSCTDVNVSITPTSSTPGLATGSILVKDSAGGNSLVIPLSINHLGMADGVALEWNDIAFTNTEAPAVAITNGAKNSITLTSIQVFNWWACDSNKTRITAISVAVGDDTIPLFSGSAQDGDEMDSTDFDFNAETSYYFSFTWDGLFHNEGEQLVARLFFSDGSVYTSPLYGDGCLADTVAPAKVVTFVPSEGSEPGSISAEFIFSGDDGFTGKAARADFRYSLCSNINSSTIYTSEYGESIHPISYTSPLLNGGETGNFSLSDLNTGDTYYFTSMFYDEVDNNSGLPDAFEGKAPTVFSVTNTNFQVSNIPTPAPEITGGSYIGTFLISDVVESKNDKQLVIRVLPAADPGNSWLVVINYDGGRTNLIRVYYPAGDGYDIPETPQFETDASVSDVDLLDQGIFGDTSFRYNEADLVQISRPNTLRVEEMTGIESFTLTVDGTTDGVMVCS